MLWAVSQGSLIWPRSVISTSCEPREGVAKVEGAWGRHRHPDRNPPPISVPPQYLHAQTHSHISTHLSNVAALLSTIVSVLNKLLLFDAFLSPTDNMSTAIARPICFTTNF